MPSMRIICVFLLVTSTAILSGCTTPRRQQQAVQTNTDIESLQMRMEQIRERLSATEDRQDRLSRDIEELRRQIADSSRDHNARLTELSGKLDQVNAARAKDRELIVEQISTKMAATLKQHQAQARPRFSSGSQTGYEHVVKEGQTLSEIAAAYGVKAGVIARANNLPNLNTIRVGQKLFIPD